VIFKDQRRTGSILAVRLLTAAALVAVLASPAAAAPQTTVVPYGAPGYRYQAVAHGAFPTFQSPSFDSSGFAAGVAPFGSGGDCPLSSVLGTFWPTNTDLLVQRTIAFPHGATDVSIGVAIDNDVYVYWNGQLVGSQKHEFCAAHDSLVVSVPDVKVHSGSNLLAVRGVDRGIESFLDVFVSADVNSAPDCAGAVASPGRLWPPNHKLRPVTLTVTDPDGDPVTVTVASVRQDEPVRGKGDGRTAPDAVLTSSSKLRLRAERSGRGNGRVYGIWFEASDGNGGSCTGRTLVGVPHDRGRGRNPVNSGLAYDSFGA
jgi:hypothetical protein